MHRKDGRGHFRRSGTQLVYVQAATAWRSRIAKTSEPWWAIALKQKCKPKCLRLHQVGEMSLQSLEMVTYRDGKAVRTMSRNTQPGGSAPIAAISSSAKKRRSVDVVQTLRRGGAALPALLRDLPSADEADRPDRQPRAPALSIMRCAAQAKPQRKGAAASMAAAVLLRRGRGEGVPVQARQQLLRGRDRGKGHDDGRLYFWIPARIVDGVFFC